MINCNTCNKSIPDDSEFCPFCGGKITHQVAENTENTYSLHLYQTDALLKRVFLFLEDGEFERVDEFCEHILNQEPENPRAYLAKMMAELQVKEQSALADLDEPCDNNKNYKKLIRFCDADLKNDMAGYISQINTRNESTGLSKQYASIVQAMEKANTEEEFLSVSNRFLEMGTYQDCVQLSAECIEKSVIAREEEEISRKNRIYNKTVKH